MRKSEKIGLCLSWLIIAVITSFPYVVGWINSSNDFVYTGLLIGVEDGNSYLAKMLAGAKGDWLFKTPYTAFPQKGFLAFFPYLLLGKLVGPDGDYHTRIFLFHLFRIVGIGFCLYAVYRFASIFIRETLGRFLALILSTFGGGLGFLYFLGLNKLWSYLPLEFYSPETFGFLSFLSIPHLLWARGLLFLGFAKFLESNSNNSLKESVIIGVLWNLLAFMQPLTVPIGWLILSAYNFVELVLASRRGFNDLKNYLHDHMLKLIVIVLVSSPLVIYTFVAFRLDPFLKAWQSQNIILSPPVIEYFLAFGLIIPFAIVGILNNNTRPKFRLLITWTCLLPFLIYAPYLLQRRLAEGSFVVFSILAINGLFHIRKRLGKLWVSWYLVNFITTFTLLAGSLDVISAKTFPLYLHKEEVQLFESVRKLIPEQSVVLADWEISTLLPAHAPVRVIIGHGPESIRAKLIREEVDLLFLQDNSIEFFKFLMEEQVDYWILSKSKTPKFLKPGSEMEFLNKITENRKYIIYKVNPIIRN